jgi:hypothetical protein
MVNRIKNSNKKIVIFIVVILILSGIFTYFILKDQKPRPSNGYTKAQAESDRIKKTSTVENSPSNNNQSSNPDNKLVMSAVQDGSNVIVTSKLYGIGEGSCVLNIDNNGKKI